MLPTAAAVAPLPSRQLTLAAAVAGHAAPAAPVPRRSAGGRRRGARGAVRLEVAQGSLEVLYRLCQGGGERHNRGSRRIWRGQALLAPSPVLLAELRLREAAARDLEAAHGADGHAAQMGMLKVAAPRGVYESRDSSGIATMHTMAGQRGEYVLLIGSSPNEVTPSVTRLLLLIQQQQLIPRLRIACSMPRRAVAQYV